ncbi:beta-galactosidase family protein [Streptomyces sp. NPDC018031]|uniref:beta-galactosidase family protein n=1 Tax=Streptomyces sp. NPDC018031 TaxID=3365033 RepID=UPI0037991691
MPILKTDDTRFLLDGRPFRILSGGLHYFRVHPEQWGDRLRKARALGLNTVETYVPWNLHQPVAGGELVLDGLLDLPRFLELAAAEGLHVLLRPGPYICAEFEGGGLPSWLLAHDGMRLRSTDPRFLAAVDEYFDRLLPAVAPYLGTRGGPVIAVQVENEYGAYGDDVAYLRHLADTMTRHLGETLLFTCDQPQDLVRGGLPGVLKTVNFGSRVGEGLAALREVQPSGPLMCTEFWIGWFDRWGGIHVVRDAQHAADALDELLAAGASVNLYMLHGGTSFGFTNGANDKHTYRPTVTSYDYDAPLDEAGDPAAKFHAFREVISRHAPVPDTPVPPPSKKICQLDIELTAAAPLFENLDGLGEAVVSERPRTMEELGQAFGFVLYEATLTEPGPALLEIEAVRDRAQVFVDGQPVGVLERERHEHTVAFTVPRAGAVLRILVENQGRVNYGPALHDRKGLVGPVALDGAPLTGWASRALPLTSLDSLGFATPAAPSAGPVFRRGTVDIEEPADTFLDTTGWTKGNAWINGFALGRYWSRGPQSSLYVPAPVLRPGRNEIVLLELHAPRSSAAVDLRDVPALGPEEE